MPRFISNCAPIGLTVLLLSNGIGAADTLHYRWINERGGTVYSDRPPPKGIEYEVVSAASGLKRVVSGDEGAVPLAVNPTPGNDFEQVNTRNTSDEKNPVLCEKARMNLISLQEADVIHTKNDKGEAIVMSDGDRAIAKETVTAQIKVYCP